MNLSSKSSQSRLVPISSSSFPLTLSATVSVEKRWEQIIYDWRWSLSKHNLGARVPLLPPPEAPRQREARCAGQTGTPSPYINSDKTSWHSLHDGQPPSTLTFPAKCQSLGAFIYIDSSPHLFVRPLPPFCFRWRYLNRARVAYPSVRTRSRVSVRNREIVLVRSLLSFWGFQSICRNSPAYVAMSRVNAVIGRSVLK